MRKLFRLKLVSVAAIFGALVLGCASTATKGPVTVLKGATMIDGAGGPPVPSATIVIADGKILAAGSAAAVRIPSGARVIDAAGKTVIPGLISNHAHLGIVQGTQSKPENYNREFIGSQLKQFEALGVTTVTSLGMNAPLFYTLRADLNQGKMAGADILGADRGIGVEAGAPPAAIVSIAPEQIYRPKSPEEGRAAVAEMSGRGTDLVKVWLDDFGKSLPAKIAPDIYAAVVDEAHKRNLRVAAHIHDMADAKAILGVGGDIVAHGVRDAPVDAEFIALMKQRNAWYIATLALDDSNFIFADRPEVGTDPLVAPWIHPQLKALISDPAWQARVKAAPGAANARKDLAMNKANLVTLYNAGIPIGFGSDSGVGFRIPGIAEHRELVLMVEAGLTPLQSLTIATSNAARLLKLDDRGTIQAGKRADLVVLDADPLQDIKNTLRINSVWHRGVEVRRN
ncbi:amidohydrolase family protein [Variovorax fucosicus]|uniref:amidohydrolase family protein n=1 Tax=Variovorax fucosicus TaxID=3053517 RepID=UPI00257818B3|nr:amidohydrolase family protein [Variovorax sp. J22G47]MDM0058881.1 amidohydrolase family protein [Variovorax sp. J22G47]